MNILEAISHRQSIRAFEKKQVNKDIIDKILSTASFAPSGGNTQPWKIYVLSLEKMKTLENSVLKEILKKLTLIFTHLICLTVLKIILGHVDC